MAKHKGDLFARLSLDYADHPKIQALSDTAFRAHVEMILYARRYLTDGRIPNRVANRFGFDAVSELMSNDDERPSLTQDERGDYWLHGFADMQETRAEVQSKRLVNAANGRRGGRPRTQPVTESVSDPVSDSGSEIKAETETETETETEVKSTLSVIAVDAEVCSSADAESEDDEVGAELIPFDPQPARPNLDDDFADWWSLYPRKVGKGQAIRAYRTARKKATAQALAAAIVTQGPLLMARGSQYCPHPATWLNGERWRDEPADLRATDSNRWTAADFAHLHERAEKLDAQGDPW